MMATKAKTNQIHKVTLRRPDGFFSVDNEILQFIPEIGVNAFAVYCLLKERAWQGDPAIGTREMGEMLGFSKSTAARAVAALEAAGLVVEEAGKSVNDPSSYVVEHAKDVLARRAGTEVKAVSGVPPMGHGVAHPWDTSGAPMGHQRPAVGTPNTEEEGIPKTKTPPTPASGGLQAEARKRERRQTREEIQRQQRAAVGAPAPVSMPIPAAPATSSREVSRGVQAALAAVRQGYAKLAEAAGNQGAAVAVLNDWDREMRGLEYESHEAPEGAAGGLMVVLTSPDPAATKRGLRNFGMEIERRLRGELGCTVSLAVQAQGEMAA